MVQAATRGVTSLNDTFQVVLLCAEDDDLELVRLVHLARQRGIELQVIPGVESRNEPFYQAFQKVKHGLFVVLRSDNLDHERALHIDFVFERMRLPTQVLMTQRLSSDPDGAAVLLGAIDCRFMQLKGTDMASWFAAVRAAEETLILPVLPEIQSAPSSTRTPVRRNRTLRFLASLFSW